MARLLDPHLVRYLVAGATVAGVYLGVTLGLDAAGVPIQLAIPLGLLVSLTLHFQLQRRFVFAGQPFAMTLRQQVTAYLGWVVIQYPLTALGTAALPGLLSVSHQVAYVLMTGAISAAGFLLMRHRIFHAA